MFFKLACLFSESWRRTIDLFCGREGKTSKKVEKLHTLLLTRSKDPKIGLYDNYWEFPMLTLLWLCHIILDVYCIHDIAKSCMQLPCIMISASALVWQSHPSRNPTNITDNFCVIDTRLWKNLDCLLLNMKHWKALCPIIFG